MRGLIKYTLFLFFNLLYISAMAQSSLLVDKTWSYKKVIIVYKQDTLSIFHIDSLKNVWHLDKVRFTFKSNNVYDGTDISGLAQLGTWSMPDIQTIVVDKDTNQIVNIDNNLITVKSAMRYRDSQVDINGVLIADLYLTPLSIGLCQSLQSGNWDNSSIWSCGHIPLSSDNVVVQPNHTILLDSTMQEAVCLNLEILGTFSMQGSSILINGNRIVIDQGNVFTK